MAARIMDDPAADLQLVGITGSNGKTTTAFLVSAALAAHYGTFALRGTVGTRLGGEEIASERTTAEGPRSEERRVGKEGRRGEWRQDRREKKTRSKKSKSG